MIKAITMLGFVAMGALGVSATRVVLETPISATESALESLHATIDPVIVVAPKDSLAPTFEAKTVVITADEALALGHMKPSPKPLTKVCRKSATKTLTTLSRHHTVALTQRVAFEVCSFE